MSQDTRDMIKGKPGELREMGSRTPLEELKAKFVEWVVKPADEWDRTFIHLQFVDVEVIRSAEAYPYPVAELRISYSDWPESGWGYFVRSQGEVTEEDIEKEVPIGIAPHAPFVEDFRDLVGLRLHLVKRRHTYQEKGDDTEEMIGDVWMLVGLEGEVAEKVDATVQAVNLMSGLTVADWQRKALQDSNVKSDAAVMSAILNNTFLPALLEEGKVTQDEDTGILHVVVG